MPMSSSVEPIRSPMSCAPGLEGGGGPASDHMWPHDQEWSSILARYAELPRLGVSGLLALRGVRKLSPEVQDLLERAGLAA